MTEIASHRRTDRLWDARVRTILPNSVRTRPTVSPLAKPDLKRSTEPGHVSVSTFLLTSAGVALSNAALCWRSRDAHSAD